MKRLIWSQTPPHGTRRNYSRGPNGSKYLKAFIKSMLLMRELMICYLLKYASISFLENMEKENKSLISRSWCTHLKSWPLQKHNRWSPGYVNLNLGPNLGSRKRSKHWSGTTPSTSNKYYSSQPMGHVKEDRQVITPISN